MHAANVKLASQGTAQCLGRGDAYATAILRVLDFVIAQGEALDLLQLVSIHPVARVQDAHLQEG